MTNPIILAGFDDTVLVEFSQFALQEFPIRRMALEGGLPSAECRAVGGPGGIVFLSHASDHYPQVRVELWSDRPEPIGEHGGVGEELAIDLIGAVRFASVTMTFSEQILPLPRDGAYGAFVSVRDDPEVERLEEGSFATTSERWLVQLWPVEPNAAQEH